VGEPIRRTRERLVHENAYVRVYDDDVAFADGTPGRYVRIEPAGDGPSPAPSWRRRPA